MRRGRKPQPTVLKVLRGNPSKRPINFSEPKPEKGAPSCPPWLDDYAREEWDRIVPPLDKIGVLTCVDGFVLEAYCTAYGHWRRHEEALKPFNETKGGHVYRPSKDGTSTYMQVLPQVAIAQRYLAMARSLASDLGLSPAMRARIIAPDFMKGEEKKDSLEAWFEKKSS